MDENELLKDELFDVQNEMNSIVDEMIEKYGSFSALSNNKGADRYQADLVRNYQALAKQKDFLVNQLDVCGK